MENLPVFVEIRRLFLPVLPGKAQKPGDYIVVREARQKIILFMASVNFLFTSTVKKPTKWVNENAGKYLVFCLLFRCQHFAGAYRNHPIFINHISS